MARDRAQAAAMAILAVLGMFWFIDRVMFEMARTLAR